MSGWITHYNAERYHQGIGGKLLTEVAASANDNKSASLVNVRSRLDGTLNVYHRAAA